MLPVPPQIDPEFDLDGVRLELEAAPGRTGWVADGNVFWLFAVPAVVLLIASAYLETLLGSGVAAMMLIGGALSIDAVRRRRSRQVVIDIERGRLHIEQRGERQTLHLGNVVEARWECTAPTTRLVLVEADGGEHSVLHVRRRGFTTPGITRKQREWVLGLLQQQLDEATSADVPQNLVAMKEQ